MGRGPWPRPAACARAPLALALLALAGCSLARPDIAPSPMAPPPERPALIAPPAPASDAVTAHFQALEQSRLAQGLLRRERAPRDVPITPHLLEDAFVQIALHDEYVLSGTRIVERATPAPLRRWQRPVRLSLEFGASVDAQTRAADRALVTRYAARLGHVTGHSVAMGGAANFHVLVVNEAERRALGPRLEQLVPGIDAVTRNLVRDLPLGVSCLVLAFSRTGTNSYTDAVAIIRAELPDLSRHACYYEELAQGLGLPNDSPRARPSLFNDSAEFAVLTVLDEKLLQMLYDPRLPVGIRAPEARPIIRKIAAEMLRPGA